MNFEDLYGDFFRLLRYAYREKVVPNAAVKGQAQLHCCYYCLRYYSIVVVYSAHYFLLSLRSQKWELEIEIKDICSSSSVSVILYHISHSN